MKAHSAIIPILLFYLFSSTGRAASNCETLLVSQEDLSRALDLEFASAISDLPGFQKLYANLRTKTIRDQLLKNCLSNKGCTASEIGQAVRHSIAMQPGLKNAVGYAFLVGVMIANAAATAEVTQLVNSQAQFSATFVGSFFAQLSFIGVSLMAPYLEPLANQLRRSTFAAVKGTRNESPTDLESQADAINATYTLREQHASDRILSLRTAIMMNFEAARVAIEEGDQEGVVAQIADAMMAGYRHFRDLNPADPTIASAVRATLLRKISNPRALAQPVLDYIEVHDSEHGSVRHGDISPQQYYRQAVRAWLETAS